jgi:hypothetical protein
MKIFGRALALFGGLLFLVNASVAAQAKADDREAVRRAVLDYVEGFYEGDTTKFVRSVSPTVYKYGYSRRGEAYVGSQMPYSGFMSFANGVKAGRNLPPANAPKEITIYDVQDQTASAKLTAWWGTDYLLVAKQNGRWVITHVMWQSPPPPR